MPSRYKAITLRHVLSHTAALPAGTDFAPAARYEGFALRDTVAAWEPGTRFHYSNTGYKLLGWLLEDVTGQDYGTSIKSRVLEPLGMAATDAVMTHQTRHRMATGYVPLHDDRPFRKNDTLIPATWMEYAVGDGSPASTAGDMARLWLNGGRSDAGPVVSPATYRLMTTPAINMARGDDYEHDYGYGFGIISHQADGHHFIGHGGSTVGFRAIMMADQTDGLGVVILCSGFNVDTYEPARYALRFAAAMRDGQPAPAPPPIPDATRVVDAGRYAGEYVDEAAGAVLSVHAEGGGLRLSAGDISARLERIDGGAFCVAHDAFDPFALRFRADQDDRGDGPMVEIHHGPAVYVRRGREPLAGTNPHPGEWTAFVGHYRSHAPYVSNFRVILRRGRLYLVWPDGGELPLTPHPSDSVASPRFLVGPAGEPSAEWVRFQPVVAGRALRALWAGGGSFYRV